MPLQNKLECRLPDCGDVEFDSSCGLSPPFSTSYLGETATGSRDDNPHVKVLQTTILAVRESEGTVWTPYDPSR
jgi:hypothetical protein